MEEIELLALVWKSIDATLMPISPIFTFYERCRRAQDSYTIDTTFVHVSENAIRSLFLLLTSKAMQTSDNRMDIANKEETHLEDKKEQQMRANKIHVHIPRAGD